MAPAYTWDAGPIPAVVRGAGDNAAAVSAAYAAVFVVVLVVCAVWITRSGAPCARAASGRACAVLVLPGEFGTQRPGVGEA